MLRLLLLILLAMLVYRWGQLALRSLLASPLFEQRGREAVREPKARALVKKEKLVGCSVCGVHVVESQALKRSTPEAPVLCSEACRERARAAAH